MQSSVVADSYHLKFVGYQLRYLFQERTQEGEGLLGCGPEKSKLRRRFCIHHDRIRFSDFYIAEISH
jgi:hypothetical protein